MCLFKSTTASTFRGSKLNCSIMGSIVLPIKTLGLYEFIKLHAQSAGSSNIFLGMNRTNGEIEFTDHTKFSGGSLKFNMEAFIFNKHCAVLDKQNWFELLGVDCNKTFEYYCLWRSEYKYFTGSVE